MNSDFIQAVRRIVERGEPPKMRASSQGTPKHPKVQAPFPRTPAVHGVAIQQQLNESAWAITWEAVPGASGYEIQTNPDPSRLMRWFVRGRVPLSSAQIKLSASNSRLWLRVRAFGLAGAGPWSDPIVLGRASQASQKAA